MYIHLRGVMDRALGLWDTVVRSREYCKFGNFREGFIFTKLRRSGVSRK